MKPVVAIVGRPNVGKSTLFNRLTRSHLAIVEDYPGVTRDRLYQDAEWNDRKFTLIDTGGIEVNSEDTILSRVRKQAQVAMEEADVIIFMCDIRVGVTVEDMEIANMLRRTKKEVILAVNKVENFNRLDDIYEYYQLGLGEPYPISASHGMNTGDLLDRLMELLDDFEDDDYEPDVIKIAVVGRPNVGKSSLTNAILGQERSIVSNIPGTTRDAIDTPFERNGQRYVIVDTAGMRRKSKVAETTTERYSVIRSLRAVDRCDAVLMVINAEEGLIEQDKKIAGYAHEQGKAIILVVNKWDLIEKDDKTSAVMEKKIRSELLFLQYAPMIFVSAQTKQRVSKILDMVNYAVEQNSMRISTSVLNEIIRDAVQLNPPPSDKGKRLKILYATQSGVKPPTFVLFVNEPEIMHFSYERFLENKIRENFGFEGTPIRFVVKKRSSEE
ncbi:MAG: ribosome biogenesis GTPase Der [Peptococcaceae bacterium]|nr:ribosome biogenesis GTPase Der [Peptococcaceae bacterium]